MRKIAKFHARKAKFHTISRYYVPCVLLLASCATLHTRFSTGAVKQTRTKTVGTGNKRRLVEIEEAVVLVPILKTIQMLLNNELTRTVLNTGIFYFMLGNLHPRHGSKYCSTHLAAICNKKLISKYSMNTVLAPTVEELKKLESFCLGHIHVNKYFSSPPASNVYVICSH